MTSRMDRHDVSNNTNNSRLSKNKELYEKLYTNSSYTEFASVDSSNVVELTDENLHNDNRRESYQKRKEYINVLGNENDSRFDSDMGARNHLIETDEEKDYDINSVLENAKKNRGESDELEKKRKLRATEYNILADLTAEKMKSHNNKKNDGLSEEEEEELEELIHTITSNKMRQELDDELLGGLMPTELDETIVSEDFSEQLISESSDENTADDDEDEVEDENEDIYMTISKLDGSFYTKSMDLSDQDLVGDDESDEEYDDSFVDSDSKKGIIVKIGAAIVITAIIFLIIVLIYNVIGGK